MFTDEFAWTHRLNTNWSLTRNINAGMRANFQSQKEFQKNLQSLFQQASTHEMARTAELRQELAYQAERFGQHSDEMVYAIDRSSENIVSAIQQMSDYFGAGLSEIRFAVERHTRISLEILRILLESLDNMSRQYFEQGIKWYENSEYDLAKDRFNKALDANLTNYFAYQYLGFIGVAQNNSDQAIRNFDLAQKIADNDPHKALALSHLARCHHATGDLSKAASIVKQAADVDPGAARYWYEFAGYSARLERTEGSIAALREAIERDWTYFTIVAIDNDFDLVRLSVNTLLDNLRKEQRQRARQALDELNRAIDTAQKAGAQGILSPLQIGLQQLEHQFIQDNVFLYRDIVPKAAEAHEQAFEMAKMTLIRRVSERKKSFEQIDVEKSRQIVKLYEPLNKLKYEMDALNSNYAPPNAFSIFVWLWLVCFIVCLLVIANNSSKMDSGAFLLIMVSSASGAGVLVAPIFAIINSLRRKARVTIPREQISQKLVPKKAEIEAMKKGIDRNYEEMKIKRQIELGQLENELDKCKRGQYI